MTGVRNAHATLQAGFTTVRDVGTFRAFVDVALRDAIDAGWTAPAHGCSAPAPTSRARVAAATSPASPATSSLPADLRFGVIRSPAEGPAARPRARCRRRRPDQADRHRRGPDPRHAADVVELDEATSGPASRKRRRTGSSSRPTPTGPRGSRSPPEPAPARSSTARCIDDEGDRRSSPTGDLPRRRPVRRRLDRGGRGARRLAGRDDGEEPARRPMRSGRGSGRPSGPA